jgi:hypothetical protein
VAGIVTAGTEGGGGGRAAGGVFGCEGSAVATGADGEGTGAGLLGGGGGAAVWTTLGLALREKRDREVREGGGKEEGTSEDTIWLSNKEMQSVFLYSLA